MTRPSIHKQLIYELVHFSSRIFLVLFFRLRCSGRSNVPDKGPVLICSNHQSFFDPVVVGISITRKMNYLARKTLFDVIGLGWLISALDAIPIDRDGMGIGGLKETLRRLKKDQMVLIFPEGTRSSDGEVLSLKPGFCALARRSKAPILPVAIDGAFQAWPKNSKFPRLSSVQVNVGEILPHDRIAAMSDEELVGEVERRIRKCHRAARKLRCEPRMADGRL